MAQREHTVNNIGELTMSESTPLCSGSRGFSSVNCCSLIPAILDSNLQRPRQYIQKHTHLRLHYCFVMQSAGFVSDLKKKKRKAKSSAFVPTVMHVDGSSVSFKCNKTVTFFNLTNPHYEIMKRISSLIECCVEQE